MKAVLVEKIGSVDDLVFKEHTLPPIDDDQVLIRTEYTGVNFPDILMAKGMYQFQPDLPFSPGGEVAGIVLEKGKNVHHLQAGDRVVSGTSWGGFAEEVQGFGSNTHKLSTDISSKDAAATMMTFGTVIHALKDRAVMKEGETLVVLGASGGVGTAAIQTGKLLGAKVIACASSKHKLEVCRQLGADQLINYSKADLKTEIKNLTDGRGADVIFDPVGGSFSESAFRGIARGGRHLVTGFASGEIPKLPWNLPLLKSASIVGVFWGGFFRNNPDENTANIQRYLSWLEQGLIRPVIDEVFSLKDAIQALRKVENREVKGKVLLEA